MVEPVQTLILRRTAAAKNRHIAEALGCDESTVSRITSGDRGIRISELGDYLAALGLMVIEVDGPAVTMSAERARAIELLAMEALRRGEA